MGFKTSAPVTATVMLDRMAAYYAVPHCFHCQLEEEGNILGSNIIGDTTTNYNIVECPNCKGVTILLNGYGIPFAHFPFEMEWTWKGGENHVKSDEPGE